MARSLSAHNRCRRSASRPERRASLLLLVLASALVVCMSGTARASEQSELLYSRGLVDFNAGRYQDALQLFNQAVTADPADVYARYYRGVAEARLEKYSAAVEDLRAVLAAKPNLDQGALELGIALTQTGQYKEAVPLLEQAKRNSALDAEASFFLGLAQLRLSQPDAARQNFQHAAAVDPQLAVSARYYQGVIDYQAQNSSAAQAHFEYVVSTSPDSEMGKDAATFLERIKKGVPSVDRPYTLFGAAGFIYDSNVQLAPLDGDIKRQAGIGNQEDGAFTILAGGAYAPWRTEHAMLSIGYSFFQSLYFQLTDFDLQNHRPSVQLAFDTGPVRYGILGQYDYYLQSTNSFMQQGTALPWASVGEGTLGRTEVFFRLRYRDYLEHAFSGIESPGSQVDLTELNGFNYAPGARQYLYLGAEERYVFLGYRWDRESPTKSSGDQFGYDGNEVSSGVGWLWPFQIATELQFSYRYENYQQASNGRHDNEYLLIASADKGLTDLLHVTLAYFGDFNDSNQSAFTYNRNIVSLSLGVRY